MPDEFTAEEKAYVDSRGEQGPAVDEGSQEPVAPAQPSAGAAPEAGKPVPGAAPERAQPDAQPPEERVPVAAIQEERRRRKEAERSAAELRAQYERLAGRVEGLQDRQQPQDQQQTDEDPLARLERLEQADAQNRQMEQVRRAHADLGSRFDHAISQFKAAPDGAPDATQAVEFLVRSRERELTEVHGIPAEEVKGMLGREMFQFLANAQQRGVDPARAAYQWARERGYQKAADPAVSRETNQERAQADIVRTTAGMAAAKSLGQASGAPGGEVTLEAIADMPMNEFGKWLGGNRDKLKAMFGG